MTFPLKVLLLLLLVAGTFTQGRSVLENTVYMLLLVYITVALWLCDLYGERQSWRRRSTARIKAGDCKTINRKPFLVSWFYYVSYAKIQFKCFGPPQLHKLILDKEKTTTSKAAMAKLAKCKMCWPLFFSFCVSL